MQSSYVWHVGLVLYAEEAGRTEREEVQEVFIASALPELLNAIAEWWDTPAPSEGERFEIIKIERREACYLSAK